MCQLCTLQPVSKLELHESEEEILKKVGSVRRRSVSHQKSSGKKSRLSDSLRSKEWRVIENRKLKSENKLERTLENLFEEEIQLLVDRLKEIFNYNLFKLDNYKNYYLEVSNISKAEYESKHPNQHYMEVKVEYKVVKTA